MKIWAAAVTLLLLLLGCFLSLATSPSPAFAQTGSITLTWTAVGDDSLTGTANRYQLRWAISPPTANTPAALESWWVGAAQITGLPVPLAAGATQSMTIPGWTTGTYYFMLRAFDEANNVSGYGNIAIKSVTDAARPAPIIDLR